MKFPKLVSSTSLGNVDFQCRLKWRPQFLIDNFENVYLEQIRELSQITFALRGG